MRLPVPLARLGYRAAYRALHLLTLIRGRSMIGVKCMLFEGERVLLVRHSYGPSAWTFPGGAIKRDEPPAATATREIQEEVGITIPQWTPLGELTLEVDRREYTVHCFEANVTSPRLELDEVEIAGADWFDSRALPHDLAPWVAPILALSQR
jgi:8-oxo-dGTP pyrophosphatase MutT (NUDIX family)